MTTMTRPATIVGVFEDRTAAQEAVNELRRMGFREDEIGVASRDGDVNGASNVGEIAKTTCAGAAAGAATGAGVGALWGLGIVAGLLPGIGPVIAGGTLAAICASAATGAAAAGLAGALIGFGVSEAEAQEYESDFHAGRTLVTVRARGREDEVEMAMRQTGGM